VKSRIEVGRGTLKVAIPELGIDSTVDVDRDTLAASFGRGEPLGVDNLIVASAVFALDRLVPRWTAPDAWTRSFDVSIPVSELGSWNAISSDLAAALRFLTGDSWRLHFARRSKDPFESEYRSKKLRVADVGVSQLFSGGLDSYAAAISTLNSSAAPVLLIGHQDQPGAPAAQARLVARFEGHSRYQGRAHLRTIRLGPSGHGLRESSSRSRSLLFIALDLYAVRALGLSFPVIVPENGFIAINPPLTLARLGASSTRTTHPHFIASLQEVWRKVGIDHVIQNPWELQTKGELLASCSDVSLLLAGAADSVSCAHAGRRAHWVRREARNCGYCWPCLIRRASLHHVNSDHGHEYGLDVLRGELPLHRASAADMRALLAALRNDHSDHEIRARVLLAGPLPGDRVRYLDVVKRGLAELRKWVSAGGTELRRLITS